MPVISQYIANNCKYRNILQIIAHKATILQITANIAIYRKSLQYIANNCKYCK